MVGYPGHASEVVINGRLPPRTWKSLENSRAAMASEKPAHHMDRPLKFRDVSAFLETARADYITGLNSQTDRGSYAGPI